MTSSCPPASPRRPPAWSIALAFTLVYLAWGTTFFAIKVGVRSLPPALFGGVRIALAGGLLLGYLALRGELPRLSRRELVGMTLVGSCLFVGGNGLITLAQRTVDSGVASVLAATSPLWVGVIEMVWPGGERLTPRGWLGVLAGLGGTALLLAPQLHEPASFFRNAGPLLVLGSAFCWALGSVVLRFQSRPRSHLAAAAYQMLLGGSGLTIIGLAAGEARDLTPECFRPQAVGAFFHLLIVGSLVGFVSYNWLLGHVPAPLAGTYAYVNPVVAILIAWLLGGETITAEILGGMVIILAGVALVRLGGVQPREEETAPHGSGAVDSQGGRLEAMSGSACNSARPQAG